MGSAHPPIPPVSRPYDGPEPPRWRPYFGFDQSRFIVEERGHGRIWHVIDGTAHLIGYLGESVEGAGDPLEDLPDTLRNANVLT